MSEINIELDNKLLEDIKKLAIRQCGDDNEISIVHVVESALIMRLFFGELVKTESAIIDEPISRIKKVEQNPLWNELWNDIWRQ